jgi:hypothetical protein
MPITLSRSVMLTTAATAWFVCVSVLAVQGEPPSLDAVLKACERKTLVEEHGPVEVKPDGWSIQEVKPIGETIDAYCKGFLEGMLAALVRAQKICLKDKDTSPDFLLSVVLTYRAVTKSKDNDAAMVIEAAFKRAFDCREPLKRAPSEMSDDELCTSDKDPSQMTDDELRKIIKTCGPKHNNSRIDAGDK